jgi:hypothetical protein
MTPMRWHANEPPGFDSSVDLERSRDHGTLVDGSIDGVIALARWAEAHPGAAAVLRDHERQ